MSVYYDVILVLLVSVLLSMIASIIILSFYLGVLAMIMLVWVLNRVVCICVVASPFW